MKKVLILFSVLLVLSKAAATANDAHVPSQSFLQVKGDKHTTSRGIRTSGKATSRFDAKADNDHDSENRSTSLERNEKNDLEKRIIEESDRDIENLKVECQKIEFQLKESIVQYKERVEMSRTKITKLEQSISIKTETEERLTRETEHYKRSYEEESERIRREYTEKNRDLMNIITRLTNDVRTIENGLQSQTIQSIARKYHDRITDERERIVRKQITMQKLEENFRREKQVIEDDILRSKRNEADYVKRELKEKNELKQLIEGKRIEVSRIQSELKTRESELETRKMQRSEKVQIRKKTLEKYMENYREEKRKVAQSLKLLNTRIIEERTELRNFETQTSFRSLERQLTTHNKKCTADEDILINQRKKLLKEMHSNFDQRRLARLHKKREERVERETRERVERETRERVERENRERVEHKMREERVERENREHVGHKMREERVERETREHVGHKMREERVERFREHAEKVVHQGVGEFKQSKASMANADLRSTKGSRSRSRSPSRSRSRSPKGSRSRSRERIPESGHKSEYKSHFSSHYSSESGSSAIDQRSTIESVGDTLDNLYKYTEKNVGEKDGVDLRNFVQKGKNVFKEVVEALVVNTELVNGGLAKTVATSGRIVRNGVIEDGVAKTVEQDGAFTDKVCVFGNVLQELKRTLDPFTTRVLGKDGVSKDEVAENLKKGKDRLDAIMKNMKKNGIKVEMKENGMGKEFKYDDDFFGIGKAIKFDDDFMGEGMRGRRMSFGAGFGDWHKEVDERRKKYKQEFEDWKKEADERHRLQREEIKRDRMKFNKAFGGIDLWRDEHFMQGMEFKDWMPQFRNEHRAFNQDLEIQLKRYDFALKEHNILGDEYKETHDGISSDPFFCPMQW